MTHSAPRYVLYASESELAPQRAALDAAYMADLGAAWRGPRDANGRPLPRITTGCTTVVRVPGRSSVLLLHYAVHEALAGRTVRVGGRDVTIAARQPRTREQLPRDVRDAIENRVSAGSQTVERGVRR